MIGSILVFVIIFSLIKIIEYLYEDILMKDSDFLHQYTKQRGPDE